MRQLAFLSRQLAFLSVSVVPLDEHEPGRTKNQLNLSLAMALESHAVEVEELGRLFPTIRTLDCFETLLCWCTIGTSPYSKMADKSDSVTSQ